MCPLPQGRPHIRLLPATGTRRQGNEGAANGLQQPGPGIPQEGPSLRRVLGQPLRVIQQARWHIRLVLVVRSLRPVQQLVRTCLRAMPVAAVFSMTEVPRQRVRQTNKQTNERTNKQTNRQTHIQTNTQTNKQTNKQITKQSVKQTNKRTHNQTDKQSINQTNKSTNKQTH